MRRCPPHGPSARPSRAARDGLRRLGVVQLDDDGSGAVRARPRRARLRPERRPRGAVRGARAGLLPEARARRAARRAGRDRTAARGGQLRSRRPRPRRPDRRDAGQSSGRRTPGRRGGRAATAGLADGTGRRAGSAPSRSRRPYGGPHGRAVRPRRRAHDHQGRRGRSRSRPLRRDRVLGGPEPGRPQGRCGDRLLARRRRRARAANAGAHLPARALRRARLPRARDLRPSQHAEAFAGTRAVVPQRDLRGLRARTERSREGALRSRARGARHRPGGREGESRRPTGRSSRTRTATSAPSIART